MIAATGLLYDGRRLEPEPAQAELAGAGLLVVRAVDGEIRTSIANVRVAGRALGTDSVLCLPGGAQFITSDVSWVERTFPARGLDALAIRLERNLTVAFACGLASLALVALFVFAGLPRLSDFVARRIPFELEEALGRQVLSALDAAGFQKSELDRERRVALEESFARFVLPRQDVSLAFRSSTIGANAFAIPGGTVLFTDDLAALLESDEQFLAIVAHEIGHHSHRHSLRAVVQESTLLITVGLLGGDAGVLAMLGAAMPRFLLQSHYSRAFEAEADSYALEALAARGISPAHFAEALQRLAREREGEPGGWLAYASTHPPTADRIARAETAASAFEAARAGADSP